MIKPLPALPYLQKYQKTTSQEFLPGKKSSK